MERLRQIEEQTMKAQKGCIIKILMIYTQKTTQVKKH